MPRIPALIVVAAVLLPAVAAGQAKQPGAPMTKDAKIKNAMSAAPATLAAKATVMDWPAKEGDKPTELRAGSNGYTCFPDFPATEGNDPMCVDQPWLDFVNAMMTKAPPKVSSIGIGYMIAPGGAMGSNTDPYAEKATPTNEWGFDGPHLMLVVPNPDLVAGLPTKRQTGRPFVMWSSTPYAHVMVPITEWKAPSGAPKP